MNRRVTIGLCTLLMACGGKEEAGVVETGVPEAPELLTGSALLRRVSFDLRGIPPTPDELDRAEAEGWSVVRDEYLTDPRLEERLVHLFSQSWHTRVDVFDIIALDYGLDPRTEYAFERAVGEEPLRLMARVVADDLPWSDVVTADWTMAEDILLSVWPLTPEDPSASGWQVARYTDGRPPVGVLASNGLWWRHTTTTSNMNRGRAAAISRLLLCEDYLVRPVSFSEAEITGSSTEDAAQSDPYCLACHASLDPVAASLFGFWWLSLYSEIEETTYHPERESLWEHFLGVEPAWYGAPISGLPDLGWSVANDSRFYSCAVETLAVGLWQRSVTSEDLSVLEDLRRTFLIADARIKPLLGAITETSDYQEATPRMLSHDQLGAALEEATGFIWTQHGRDLLDSDETGYRLLFGGVDGIAITTPQREPGLTWALGVQQAAQGAADHVVRTELEGDSERRLFDAVTLSDRPGDPTFDAELRLLHRTLFSSEADETWLSEIQALWQTVADESSAENAWRAVITVMLSDPAFLSY